MTLYFRNAISKIYNAISAPVAATRDALTNRLKNVRDSITLLYNKTKEKIGYGQPTLYDEIEKEAKKNYIEIETNYTGIEDIKHLYSHEKKEHQGVEDIQYIFDEHDMRLLEDGNKIKTWRLAKNLNNPLTEAIMHQITPDNLNVKNITPI